MKKTSNINLHPIQDIILDSNGTPRFRENAIVRYMLEMGKFGGTFNLNTLALQQFSDEDRMQLAQLIGYSISGYGDLSYVSDESYSEVEGKIKMKNYKVCLESNNEFPASIPSGPAQPVVVLDSKFKLCCSFMEEKLKQECVDHDKFECPDVVVIRSESGGFGIPIHDGGESYIVISFCPWCGKELSG